MDNASKALLMAGGMLIALLTISVLVLMFTRISAVQRTDNEDEAVETTTEVNNQFSTYNNDHVRGSELYSCLNAAVNYNQRVTTASVDESGIHNERSSEYKPITIKVNFKSMKNKFAYDEHSGNKLFTGPTNTYLVQRIYNQLERSVLQKALDYEKLYTKVVLAKLVANINIFSGPLAGSTDVEIVNDINKVEKYEQIAGRNATAWCSGYSLGTSYETNRSQVVANLNALKSDSCKIKKVVYEYYEYVQFKRGLFKCTKCEYDDDTGRIVNMEFEFTGNFN